MEKFCTQCGAPLPESAPACPGCGAPVPPVPQKKALKWWMIAVPVFLVLVIAIALFWTPLSIRIAPEAALARAAAKTGRELSERYDGSPWEMMRNAYNPDGQGRISLRMDVQNDYYSASFDGGLSFDSNTQQAAVDFLMNAAGEALDTTLYLDSECAAISSDAIMSGVHYGITYETFSQDIRSSILFADLDEETISMLEEIVKTIQTSMQRFGTQQENAAKPYREAAIDFWAGMEPVVGSAQLALDGSQRSCSTITYTATGDMTAEFLERIISVMEEDEAIQAFQSEELWQEYLTQMRGMAQSVREEITECSAVFYIYRNYLVDVQSVAFGTDGSRTVLELFLGADASANDLRLSLFAPNGAESFDVSLATEKSETGYSETLTIEEAGETALSVSYDWNSSSGSLVFEICNAESPAYSVNCDLIELDEGFALSFDDLCEAFSGTLGNSGVIAYGSKVPMTLTVKEGSAIEKPMYKNIDSWTEDDFFSILNKFL